LTIHILAAVAEYEREMILKWTKFALEEAKRRGRKTRQSPDLRGAHKGNGAPSRAPANPGSFKTDAGMAAAGMDITAHCL
jgi:hypothetical protein